MKDGSDLVALGYATGGFIANPDRPFIVGEQPQCYLGTFYPGRIPKMPPPRPEGAPYPARPPR